MPDSCLDDVTIRLLLSTGTKLFEIAICTSNQPLLAFFLDSIQLLNDLSDLRRWPSKENPHVEIVCYASLFPLIKKNITTEGVWQEGTLNIADQVEKYGSLSLSIKMRGEQQISLENTLLRFLAELINTLPHLLSQISSPLWGTLIRRSIQPLPQSALIALSALLTHCQAPQFILQDVIQNILKLLGLPKR